jgi:hypothetical protein
MTEPSVYLSYVPADRSYAERVRSSLRSHGIVVQDPLREIAAGEMWQESLAKILANASVVVFIVGDQTFQSSFIQHEARIAGEAGKPIVLAKVDASSVIPSPFYKLETRWTTLDDVTDAVQEMISTAVAST